MKSFNIPEFYHSPVISKIKGLRKLSDPKKKDFSPTQLDFGTVRFYIARHFGFCYGVENAIEISFRALEENPGKRIFLLSQMIHNPDVNNDLISRGVKFLMDTSGNQIIPWSELRADDIVIIPAFGTTLAIEEQLKQLGIEPHRYNTTCPFVERVWKKSEKLGADQYSIIIHGKHNHEETRATFSRSEINAPSIIIKDIHEARKLGDYILGKVTETEFIQLFKERISPGFDPRKDLERIGVINQTTMLATETQEIADYFKNIMLVKFGENVLKDHFADTRDTLCYATNENQEATYGLLKEQADLAIVVGGYNSSNTSHIVELCENKLPTYFISGASEILSSSLIRHYNYHQQKLLETPGFLPAKTSLRIILTSGASCPDSVVEAVLQKILSFFPGSKSTEEVMESIHAL
ncbi:MAG TPA: 4-hydroxy-3-methylbut-2-enyl diphosphate reductase [Bacteroidia bacterium]|jgi:4-hydroxy-3-methylbut-2-enyl diphosphate reductase|nr:4-hydroxy-3-methylbut-2-enyl diphosphate reductase [Bacteroidia bacterium]